MKKIQAYQKFIRQSPRKLRLAADMVRGMELNKAIEALQFTSKRAARTVKQVLLQAKANLKLADKGEKIAPVIDQIMIEEGPRLKRWQPVSRGRAHPILKRMSHIKVIVMDNPAQKKGS